MLIQGIKMVPGLGLRMILMISAADFWEFSPFWGFFFFLVLHAEQG